MTKQTLEVILVQMAEATRNMRSFAEGMSFEDYQRDAKTRLAVERCIEIVSEAARRLPTLVQASSSDFVG